MSFRYPPLDVEAAAEQTPERVFTANGQIRRWISINSGERQFWRIVNASPDRYADLQLGREQLEIVALDGMPLAYHNLGRTTKKIDHVLIPPSGRVEAIIIGPPSGSQYNAQYGTDHFWVTARAFARTTADLPDACS